MPTRKIPTILGVFALLLVLIAVGYYWWSSQSPLRGLDTSIRTALTKVTDIHSYIQHVETHIEFPDRSLDIAGDYLINEPAMTYSARSTTTLGIPGIEEHPSFHLQNISIGGDVYITVGTASPLLETTIPVSPWRHFKADAIPHELEGIAISGPVLDNLQLLREKGRYVKLLEDRTTALWGDESLLKYVFTLSGASAPDSGTVAALIHRIATGTISIWIDPTSYEIRHLVFSNPPYYSTTSLSQINAVPEVLPPISDR